jgi:hypothetical protein
MAVYQYDTKLGSDDRQVPSYPSPRGRRILRKGYARYANRTPILVSWHTDLMNYIFSLKRLAEVRPNSFDRGPSGGTAARLQEEAHPRNN